MELIVLRHGIAEELHGTASLLEDRRRALTDRGRSRMRKGTRGLARLVPRLAAIGTSSLVRAAETAQIVAAAYAGLKPSVLEDLEPGGSRAGLIAWLGGQAPDAAVLLVGHSPSLEGLASWLLAGVTTPFVRLNKGGACLLRIETAPGPATAQLVWLLGARALRRIA
jgi:phosphohistidine phosphatase